MPAPSDIFFSPVNRFIQLLPLAFSNIFTSQQNAERFELAFQAQHALELFFLRGQTVFHHVAVKQTSPFNSRRAASSVRLSSSFRVIFFTFRPTERT